VSVTTLVKYSTWSYNTFPNSSIVFRCLIMTKAFSFCWILLSEVMLSIKNLTSADCYSDISRLYVSTFWLYRWQSLVPLNTSKLNFKSPILSATVKISVDCPEDWGVIIFNTLNENPLFQNSLSDGILFSIQSQYTYDFSRKFGNSSYHLGKNCGLHCDLGFGWFFEPSEEFTVKSIDLLVDEVAEL